HPGDEITLSGSGFDRVTSVVFGNVPAAFTIVNSGSIKVTIPTTAPVGAITLVTPTGGAKSQQTFVVQPSIQLNFGIDDRAHLSWGEMNYPFTVQCTSSLTSSDWADILTTVNHQLDLPLSSGPVFYRLVWNPIPLNPVDYNRDRPAVASFYWRDPVNYWATYGVPTLARLANMQTDLGSANMEAFNGFLTAFDSSKFMNALQTHLLPDQFESLARSYLTNNPNLTNAYINSFITLVAVDDKLSSCPDLFRTNCLKTNQLSSVFAKVLTNTANVNTLTNWAPQTNKIFFNPSQQTNTPSINWVDTHGSDAFAVTQITTAHSGDNDTSFTKKWSDITSSTIWNTTLNGACANVAVGASLAKLGVGPAETTCRFWNELAGLMGTTTNIVGAYDDGIAGLYKSLGYGCNGAYDGPIESAVEEAKKALARGCDVQIDYTSADGTRGHTELVHSITIDPTDSSKATISTLSWGQNATVSYSGGVLGGTYSGKSDGSRYRKTTETSSWLEVSGSATLRYYCKE
ncbi:MAG TPA: IPT/TIG domain-containing protein, partial [Verrucomicrobiae bacterium]|nr:IPT/TIG domain-containing protein [Verrucomicrobiae bacterium]